MKMIYNGTPIKSLNIKHFEMDTNSATVQPTDLQAGVTCYARGQKVTGTGKAFSFATYGSCPSNQVVPIPVSEINTVIIGADGYAVKMTNTTLELRELDFSTSQEVANVVIDGNDCPIYLQINNNILTITCSQNVILQVMFGKDDYI